jgi:hypothetical protein
VAQPRPRAQANSELPSVSSPQIVAIGSKLSCSRLPYMTRVIPVSANACRLPELCIALKTAARATRHNLNGPRAHVSFATIGKRYSFVSDGSCLRAGCGSLAAICRHKPTQAQHACPAVRMLEFRLWTTPVDGRDVLLFHSHSAIAEAVF